MTSVERAGEALARRLDRSSFLRKSAMSIFGFTAAAAVQGVFAPRALANACQQTTTSCTCQPLAGNWCDGVGGNCVNGNCDTRYCQYDFGTWASTACWCTQTCCYLCHTPSDYCDYYHCCDCSCNGTPCTCKGFVYTCMDTGAAANTPTTRDTPAVFKCC